MESIQPFLFTELYSDFGGPPPTRLLPLVPCGLRTGMLESFPSYLNRLCRVHGMAHGTFISRELVPRLFPGWDRWRDLLNAYRANILVGTSFDGRVSRLAPEVAQLTGVSDVRRLRQLDLSQKILLRLHLRRHMAWCPACLAYWEREGQPVFVPLLWAFTFVTCCPEHSVPLIDCCPNCGGQFPHWGPRSWSATCYHCGEALCDVPLSSEACGSLEVRTAHFMCALLEWGACRDAPFDCDRLVSNIVLAAKVLGSHPRLSNLIGLDSLCSWRWSQNEIPNASALVRLCVAFDLSPQSWLCDSLCEAQLQNRTQLPSVKVVPVSRSYVEAGLKAALLVEPPSPLSFVARSLGVSHETVWSWFPDLHAALVLRYKNFVHERRYAKDMRRGELVREAIAHFKALGKTISARQAVKFLGSRWTESQQHFDFVYRRILADDQAYGAKL